MVLTVLFIGGFTAFSGVFVRVFREVLSCLVCLFLFIFASYYISSVVENKKCSLLFEYRTVSLFCFREVFLIYSVSKLAQSWVEPDLPIHSANSSFVDAADEMGKEYGTAQ